MSLGPAAEDELVAAARRRWLSGSPHQPSFRSQLSQKLVVRVEGATGKAGDLCDFHGGLIGSPLLLPRDET